MNLRPATDADWPTAWAIQREAFLDSVTRTYGGWTDEQVRKCEVSWNASQTRMIELDGEVVGWVRVEHRTDEDWLDLLVIATHVQNRGLGGEAMRMLMAEARGREVRLALSVYRTNPALRLYRRLGFDEQDKDELRVAMWIEPDPFERQG